MSVVHESLFYFCHEFHITRLINRLPLLFLNLLPWLEQKLLVYHCKTFKLRFVTEIIWIGSLVVYKHLVDSLQRYFLLWIYHALNSINQVLQHVSFISGPLIFLIWPSRIFIFFSIIKQELIAIFNQTFKFWFKRRLQFVCLRWWLLIQTDQVVSGSLIKLKRPISFHSILPLFIFCFLCWIQHWDESSEFGFPLHRSFLLLLAVLIFEVRI